MCFSPYFYGFDFENLRKEDLGALRKRLEAEIGVARAKLADLERICGEIDVAISNIDKKNP